MIGKLKYIVQQIVDCILKAFQDTARWLYFVLGLNLELFNSKMSIGSDI